MESASNPVAIVTGAGQGIGRCIVERLLADGYHVAAFENDAEALGELSAQHQGDRFQGYEVDVGADGSVRNAVDSCVRHFGALDALVNNAGIGDPYNPQVECIELADWERVLRTNLTGAFLCVKRAASQLRRSKRASIVNIASTRALQAEPRQEAYAASKGGLLSLTYSLAVSLGPDIRVNAVSPGWIDVSELKKQSARRPAHLRKIDHQQHPVGRVGRGEDVAAQVAFLLSPAAGFITAQNFVIDGGMSRKMIYAE